MPYEFASFTFIISLAAVVNGLGIVRWLTSLSEYVRRKGSLNVQHYWVFSLFAGFQFLLHILVWWSLWGVRSATTDLNFLMYVYVLAGPVLLYLGTSVLAPDMGDNRVNMRAQYITARRTYSSVLALLWLWAIFMGLVLQGEFAPPASIYAVFLAVAVTQRLFDNGMIQATLAVLNWMLLAYFVAGHAMQLGGT